MSRKPSSRLKRIILFRFHKNLAVCKNRLQLLRKFNPGIDIYGLGDESNFREAQQILRNKLKHIYYVPKKTAEWKWKNGDLAVRLWFKNYGKNLSFDMLHVIEWDLLLFDSLSRIYSRIPKNSIGLTGLTPLKNAGEKWHWISEEPYKSDWLKLLKFVKNRYGYNKKPFACLGPGYCLPRKFLEKYASINVPELCHDELRLPLFAQILGFKLYDTKFYKKWWDKEEHKFFNCENEEIEKSTILKELSKASGRRVFHPYRKVWSIK